MSVLSTTKDAFHGLWTAALQWVINGISGAIFDFKKKEAQRLSKTNTAKYYVVQSGYFKFAVFRAKDIDIYKKKGFIKKTVTAKELESISAYVADPMRVVNVVKQQPKKK